MSPVPNVSTDSSLVLLNSAMTQLMRRIRRVDDAQGIGRARLSVLAVLHFGGPATPSELAVQEMVSRATMHHIVKGLERDGYTWKSAHPSDARRQIIRLTPKGRAAIRKAHAARIAYLRSLAAGIEETLLAAAARAVSELRNAAREQE